MRKKHTEMPREYGEKLVDENIYGVLSFYNENKKELYSVPMSFVRIDENLYFHTGKVGKKVELFEDGLNVTVVFVRDAKSPTAIDIESLRKIKKEEGNIKKVKSKVFTNEFSSCIINGKLNMVEDEKLRNDAIYALCEKYNPEMKEFFNEAIGTCMHYTSVYKIYIDEISVRQKLVDM